MGVDVHVQLLQELDGSVHSLRGSFAAFVAAFGDPSGLVRVVSQVVVVELCVVVRLLGGGEGGGCDGTDPFIPFHASQAHRDKIFSAVH